MAIQATGVKSRDNQPAKEFEMILKYPNKEILSEHVGLPLEYRETMNFKNTCSLLMLKENMRFASNPSAIQI